MDVDYLMGNIMPPSPLFYVAQRNINFLGDESFPVAEEAFDLDNSLPLFPEAPGPEAMVHTKKYIINLKFESKSWQYSWKSTRCTKDTQHAFIVSVLSPPVLPSPPPSDLFCESSDYPSIGEDDRPAPQQLRRLLQRASQSFTVSCVRRSDKAKQVKKHEKTSMKSMCLLQSILDQSSGQQFTPCILPRDLMLAPQLCDEDDDEQCASVPSQLRHRCNTTHSRKSLSSSSSGTLESECICEVGYKRGHSHLFCSADDGMPNVYTTNSSNKSNSADISPTLEAAYRNVFGFSE